jgi:hypothetical protein
MYSVHGLWRFEKFLPVKHDSDNNNFDNIILYFHIISIKIRNKEDFVDCNGRKQSLLFPKQTNIDNK